MHPDELAHRRALGIPDDAERVLMVLESSHWDVDWLLTSDEYLRFRVAPIIDKVLAELAAEPGRVWNLEALWFLREYLQAKPERTDEVVELLRSRRLRLAGFAWTTPDTLLPHPEALLRDYADGQRWLRELGVAEEPDIAFLPDSFGHSPALPALLGTLGIRSIALTRVDGMFFPGADWKPRSAFPVPGSTAARLTDLGSADVVWRDTTGAELLTHWNAFTYGHADLLAAHGYSRWMGLPTFVPDRSERHVANRLRGYVADLAPLARTPYLLLTAGLDFVDPIPRLGELLRRWNERQYPAEGVWALTAGLDDYLGLVDHHRADLPVLELDPNPYWTGFYSARPAVKRKVHTLVSRLLARESAALASDGPAGLAATAPELEPAWRVALASNHHDFVTGTSPDRVVAKEQDPWLEDALALVPADTAATTLPPPGTAAGLPGMELLAVTDSGGLWRMGHEFPGGRFTERKRFAVPGAGRMGGASARVDATDLGDGLVRLDCRVAAADGTTMLLRIPLPHPTDDIRTGVTGGWIDRPAHREQTPTFWCVNDWLSVAGRGLLFDRPVAVAVEPGGEALLVVVGRNANHERAHRVVRFLGMPIGGHDHSEMELAAITWQAAAQTTPTEVNALRDRLRAMTWPAAVLRAGESTDGAAVRAVVPFDGSVHVRVQVHEPGEFEVTGSWPGAAAGTWRAVDARGRPLALGRSEHREATAAWRADRPGWVTWAWEPARPTP